jgi:hypothetical protein
MSKILDQFEFGQTVKTTKYPWDLWFDGRIHVLEEGVDFDRDPQGMRVTVLIRGRKRGLEVRTAVRDHQVIVQVVGTR